MPMLRPSPVDLRYCAARERSRWAAHARLLCGAGKRCPVILAYDLLCPPCLIGKSAHYARWEGYTPLYPSRRDRRTGELLVWCPRTVRALVGSLFLSMSAQMALPLDTPLPIVLDWLEEAGWIDCVQRRYAEQLGHLVPVSVDSQRAQLGHLSPPWPRQAPRPFAIQHAYPLLIEKGSL